MQAGQLDRRITLQTLDLTQDVTGQPIEGWSTLDTIWARVRSQRGAERFDAQQVVGRAVTTFLIRHRTDIEVDTMRIQYDSRDWDITDVRELGRKEGIEIDATARSED